MNDMLVIEGRESLLDNIPVPKDNFRIGCADWTDIIFRKVFKFCPWFDPAMGFSSFFIVDIIAHGTNIACRSPFIKAPFANLAFSLKSTDGTEIRFRKIFKGGACRNAIMRLTPKG